MTDLSAAAKRARRPLRPEELADARHDQAHRDLEGSRPARTIRNARQPEPCALCERPVEEFDPSASGTDALREALEEIVAKRDLTVYSQSRRDMDGNEAFMLGANTAFEQAASIAAEALASALPESGLFEWRGEWCDDPWHMKGWGADAPIECPSCGRNRPLLTPRNPGSAALPESEPETKGAEG